jgi:chemotaxis protein CheD
MENDSLPRHYLLPGGVFAHPEPHQVTTVLGSCVAVCLWDSDRRLGGINHYLLALWNGEGLPTPRYGNIAIHKLAEKVERAGAKRSRIKAKIFGGSSILQTVGAVKRRGAEHQVAVDLLEEWNRSSPGTSEGPGTEDHLQHARAMDEILPSISAAARRRLLKR